MSIGIYRCPQGHVSTVGESQDVEDHCEYIVKTDATGAQVCGAHPLAEVDDPQQILALAQDLKVGDHYGQDSVHILADTALWRRMVQLDHDFALAYLRLMDAHNWSY